MNWNLSGGFVTPSSANTYGCKRIQFFSAGSGHLNLNLKMDPDRQIMPEMNVTNKCYIVPLTEEWYINPEEGELPPGAIRVLRAEGFFGPAYSSSLHVAESKGHTSKGFSCAVEYIRPVANKARIKEYYKIQSLQWLGERKNQVSIPIWIARNVDAAWIEHIRQAISDINYAAPGLRLFITSDESVKGKIDIFGTREGSCYTWSDMLDVCSLGCKIYLDWRWPEKKRTSCHELLHALGFGHEHQRRDRDSSIHVESEESEENSQYCKEDNLLGITRFDPHSILMYPEEQALLRNTDDPVWFTKPTTEINREMSELDKVSLNNLYRPCKGPLYSPTKFGKGVTGLWYCGR